MSNYFFSFLFFFEKENYLAALLVVSFLSFFFSLFLWLLRFFDLCLYAYPPLCFLYGCYCLHCCLYVYVSFFFPHLFVDFLPTPPPLRPPFCLSVYRYFTSSYYVEVHAFLIMYSLYTQCCDLKWL